MDVLTTGDASGVVGEDFSVLEFDPDVLGALQGIEIGSIDTLVIDGVTMASWLEAFLLGSSDWAERLAVPTAP